jgi:ubiquinone/menaquinone biosynthesis C-methylase UbiE
MSKFTDQQYLKTDQYRDSSNLDARVVIHQRFSTNSYGWFKWVFDAVAKLPDNARILELGCGPGYLWKENVSRIPVGWHITLSDLSSGMLDAAWRNLVLTGRAFKFEEIDAQSIPYDDETFDVVIANHMLYHVPDRSKAIGEIKRALKHDGYLLATTVGDNHMKEMMDWLRIVSIGKPFESFANSFTLENGLDQLKQFFAHVTISRYADSLQVTDVEPIMAYMRSSIRASELSEEELENVQRNLQDELMTKSKISITKDSGLFKAIK